LKWFVTARLAVVRGYLRILLERVFAELHHGLSVFFLLLHNVRHPFWLEFAEELFQELVLRFFHLLGRLSKLGTTGRGFSLLPLLFIQHIQQWLGLLPLVLRHWIAEPPLLPLALTAIHSILLL